jgi:hypothetical protein
VAPRRLRKPRFTSSTPSSRFPPNSGAAELVTRNLQTVAAGSDVSEAANGSADIAGHVAAVADAARATATSFSSI